MLVFKCHCYSILTYRSMSPSVHSLWEHCFLVAFLPIGNIYTSAMSHQWRYMMCKMARKQKLWGQRWTHTCFMKSYSLHWIYRANVSSTIWPQKGSTLGERHSGVNVLLGYYSKWACKENIGTVDVVCKVSNLTYKKGTFTVEVHRNHCFVLPCKPVGVCFMKVCFHIDP